MERFDKYSSSTKEAVGIQSKRIGRAGLFGNNVNRSDLTLFLNLVGLQFQAQRAIGIMDEPKHYLA